MTHASAFPSPLAGAEAAHGDVPAALVERVRACFGTEAQLDAVDVPDKTKVVADDPVKRLIVDGRRRPWGVVFWAPASAPGRIARDMDRLEQARTALGDGLGEVVLQPRETGWIDQRSYAIVPYCKPFADRGVAGHLHRASLRPRLLHWLEQVTAQTQHPVEQEHALREAIDHLASLSILPSPVRTLASDAGRKLLAGPHQPRHVLCHNDLWAGNILRAPRGDRFGFVLIDWGASRTDGFPIYDLLRLAVSLRLGARALRRELNRHCAALDCGPEDAVGYLAAALGQLGLNREHFPLDRYAALVESCFRQLHDIGVIDAS